jgi:enoyl-CoA hydratase
MDELGEVLAIWDADPAIGAMVITGSDRAFAAGADIKEMADSSAVDMLLRDHIGGWDRVTQMHKPVIAAVSGYALGGGCELAMMCDMIIASETAVFGQPEINLGVMPGAGGTQRLVRAVGKSITMEMVLNDRRLSAEEAYQFGLISHIYPLEEYLEQTLRIAGEIAARAPVAVRLAKESVNKAFETSLAQGNVAISTFCSAAKIRRKEWTHLWRSVTQNGKANSCQFALRSLREKQDGY